MSIPAWAWLLWALAFVVMETVALLNATPNDTLTATIARYVPPWAFFAALGWASWHFAYSYINRKKMRR